MKLGLKVLVVGLVMALAAVPAAFAKGNGHGNGKGHGGGKPSWVGSEHAHVKGLHEKKAKKDKAKHHQVAATTDEGTQSGAVDLEGLNPAWYCKTLRDGVTLATAFADMFGTNSNGANAFGKCVSRRAHGEDLSGAAGGDDQQDTCDTTEPPATDGTDTTGAEGSGTDTTASEDAATTGDLSSGDGATDPEACESDDSASDEPVDDQGEQNAEDEQGENEQGGDESDTTVEDGSSDLGAALRFLRF
jgi:hypothetical protein